LTLFVSPAKHGGQLVFALSVVTRFVVVVVDECHTFIVQNISSMLFDTG